MTTYVNLVLRSLGTWLGRPAGSGNPKNRPALDLEACRSFAERTAGAPDGWTVDDITWRDLDMDAVFANMDRTLTGPGRLVLYRMLRSIPTAEARAERRRAMRALADDAPASASLQRDLGRFSRWQDRSDVVELLWDPLPDRKPLWPYWLLGLAGPAAIAAPFWLGGFGLLCFIAVALLNTYVHFRTRILLSAESAALRQLGGLLGVAAHIGRLVLPGAEHRVSTLAAIAFACKGMARQIARLPSGALDDFLLEYVRVALMSEARTMYSLLDQVRERRDDLRLLFEHLGELDALQSLAAWRSELPLACDPEIAAGSRGLQIVDAVHPLLETPVANSIHLDTRGAVVTGANMSGKSTFLRTLGVNVLLAQTVGTCTARAFRLRPLRVISSMRLTDDLLSAQSLYMAEAQRLLTLLRAVDDTQPSLCLIDELLAGTNAQERSAASVAILSYLSRRESVVVVTTHDCELASELSPNWDSYHFAEDESPSGLLFDYRLRPGLTATHNALQILEQLGFPSEIVVEARARLVKAT